MTSEHPPRSRSGTPCCRFSELRVGDQLSDAVTITETHVVLAAALFKDPGPNHVNTLQAESNQFGTRIAHGPLLIGVLDGILGNVLGSTLIALIDQHVTFRSPTAIGDTVLGRWNVAELIDKPRFGGGGIVRFEGEAHNQDDRLLAEVTAVLAVADKALWRVPPVAPAIRCRRERS